MPHQGAHVAQFVGIEPDRVAAPFSAGELDVEGMANELAGWSEVRIVEPCFEQTFGHRILRFRNLDGHLIEVGRPLQCRRLP